MKIRFLAVLLFKLVLASQLCGQEIRKEVFDLIDLNREGLKEVQTYVQEKRYEEAALSLLEYYKNRVTVNHPDVDLTNINILDEEKKWAEDGLKHVFFAHGAYQPSYFYGDDIDWEYWPVKDNELRWQLHRHKWWIPMAKVYRLSGDERYAEEWTKQYLDWIKKNPLLTPSKEEMDTMGIDMLKKMENVRFAWRTLEVSERIEVQTVLFLYFLKSEHFTPAFLTEFLLNFYRHAEHVRGNFSEKGNFLLFESQRMIYAGTIFPEFKQAEVWRNTGIDILNQEIKNQVYDDGFQYELDPHYHIHSIYIFVKAIKVADCNGFKNEFSDVYLHTVEKMIMAVIDISYPDYRLPCFSDNRQASKTEMLRDLRSWSELFPHNKYIRYMATEGKEGILPSHLSKSYPTAGFYVFRNGWGKDATIMILKAGPQAFWHNQPDNGTFEMYFKGRNFFPDSGCFVYGGDDKVNAERAWFRQTRVHNTLTLNKNNIENTNSKCLLWDADSAVEKLVIENQSYVDLTHRRAVFFVDKSFFVIVDEAEGNAIGDVAIHYQLSEGDVDVSPQQLKLNTRYHDNNNILIQGFGNKGTQLLQEEGWVSYVYRVKHKRPAISFLTHKNSTDTVRFITVIYPISDKTPKVSACFKSALQNNINVLLKINGKKYNLEAKW